MTAKSKPTTQTGQSKNNLHQNKQAREALPKSRALFQNTLDSMLEGCQILDFDWRYLYLNPVAEIHNRRPNQELLGNLYMEMWPGIESTEVFAEIKHCLEDRVPTRLENRFVYPDGKVGWFDLSIQPIEEGVVLFSEDITERKQTEQEISWLASFPELNPNPVVEIDSTGAVSYLNPAARHRFPVWRKSLFDSSRKGSASCSGKFKLVPTGIHNLFIMSRRLHGYGSMAHRSRSANWPNNKPFR
jgi:PAS domain S-box-containing protein